MSEDSNEKTAARASKRSSRVTGRIARRSHRPLHASRRGGGFGGRGVRTAASEPARRRPRKALLAVGVAASAIALCAIVASMGFATGWLGDPVPSDPVPDAQRRHGCAL